LELAVAVEEEDAAVVVVDSGSGAAPAAAAGVRLLLLLWLLLLLLCPARRPWHIKSPPDAMIPDVTDLVRTGRRSSIEPYHPNKFPNKKNGDNEDGGGVVSSAF
jgi:hypothetical protein